MTRFGDLLKLLRARVNDELVRRQLDQVRLVERGLDRRRVLLEQGEKVHVSDVAGVRTSNSRLGIPRISWLSRKSASLEITMRPSRSAVEVISASVDALRFCRSSVWIAS